MRISSLAICHIFQKKKLSDLSAKKKKKLLIANIFQRFFRLSKLTQISGKRKLNTDGESNGGTIFTFFKALLFHTSITFFSFQGSHLLPGQDLDATGISIPFQIYFFQATTTRLLPLKLQ